MADAKLSIITKLDNSEIPKDLQELNNMIEKGAVDEKTALQIKKLAANWDKYVDQLEKVNRKHDETKSKLQEVERTAKSLDDQIENKSAEIRKLEETIRLRQENIDKLREQLRLEKTNEGKVAIKTQLRPELEANAKDLEKQIALNAEINETISKYDQAKKEAQGLADAVLKTEAQHASINLQLEGVEIKSADLLEKTQQIEVGTEKVKKNLGKSSRHAKDMSKSMGSGVKKLIKYSMALLGVRSLYMGLRKAMNAWTQATLEGQQAQADLKLIWESIGNALAPIFEYIIRSLRTILGYMAAITESFFGINIFAKSTAKGTGAISKGLSSANKEAKKLHKQMAGFDEMNVLNQDGSVSGVGAGGGGGGGEVIGNPITPEMNPTLERYIENVKALIELLGEPLKAISFDPLMESLTLLWQAMLPLIEIGGDFLLWFYMEVMVPLAQWTIEDLLPAWITFVAETLKVLTKVIKFFQPYAEWLWEEVLVPFGKYSGEALTSFIELLTELMTSFGNWIESDGNLMTWLLEYILYPIAKISGIILLDFIKMMNDYFQQFTNWIRNNQPTMSFFFDSFTLFLGAIALYWTVGKVKALLTWLPRAFGLLAAKLAIMNVPLLITGAGLIALAAGAKAIGDNWHRMNGLEKTIGVLSLLTIAATTAAVAFGALQSAWSLGLAAVAIAAGVASITWSINSANRRAKAEAEQNAKLPRLPKLAKGGITTGATKAIIGEDGREAVVPLEKNTGWAKDFLSVLDNHGGGLGSGTIINKIYLDSREIAVEVKKTEKEMDFATNGRMKYVY